MGKGGDRVDSVFKKPVKAPKTLEKILVGVLSATPSPPVRIRSSPLMNLEGLNLQGFLLFLKNRSMYYLYIQDHHKIEEIHKSAKNLHKSAKSAKTT